MHKWDAPELDEQRRAEKRAVEAQKNKKQKAEKEAKLEVLKRSKYSLLKNEEDLTEPQKIKLEAIKENFSNLKKMQELKEAEVLNGEKSRTKFDIIDKKIK